MLGFPLLPSQGESECSLALPLADLPCFDSSKDFFLASVLLQHSVELVQVLFALQRLRWPRPLSVPSMACGLACLGCMWGLFSHSAKPSALLCEVRRLIGFRKYPTNMSQSHLRRTQFSASTCRIKKRAFLQSLTEHLKRQKGVPTKRGRCNSLKNTSN